MMFTKADHIDLVIPRNALEIVFDECDRYDADETGGRVLGNYKKRGDALTITVTGIIEPGPGKVGLGKHAFGGPFSDARRLGGDGRKIIPGISQVHDDELPNIRKIVPQDTGVRDLADIVIDDRDGAPVQRQVIISRGPHEAAFRETVISPGR